MIKSLEWSCIEDLFYDIFLNFLAVFPIQLSWYMCVYAGHIPARWRRASLIRYAGRKNICALTSSQLENLCHLLSYCSSTQEQNDVDDTLAAWVGSSPAALIHIGKFFQDRGAMENFTSLTRSSIIGNAKLAKPDQDKLCASLLKIAYLRLLSPNNTIIEYPSLNEKSMSAWVLTSVKENLSCLVELMSYFNYPPSPDKSKEMSLIINTLLPIFEHLPQFFQQESAQDIDWLNSYIRAGYLSGLTPAMAPQERDSPCL